MAKKKTIGKKELLKIERAAKRAAQQAQGALDGRFRQRVARSARTYSRKKRRPEDE